jgi:hypothetical protein
MSALAPTLAVLAVLGSPVQSDDLASVATVAPAYTWQLRYLCRDKFYPSADSPTEHAMADCSVAFPGTLFTTVSTSRAPAGGGFTVPIITVPCP